jgi:hypothetical protein
MTKRNLKIAITPEQPLDDVVRELDRIGYKRIAWWGYKSLFIVTNGEKRYTDIDYDSPNFALTTLAELKEME